MEKSENNWIEVYAIRDAQAETFTRPFVFINEAMAMRSFMHACIGADKSMSENPEDYTLYRIGYFDDVSGIITGFDPVRVETGLEALARSRQIQKQREELEAQLEEIENDTQ